MSQSGMSALAAEAGSRNKVSIVTPYVSVTVTLFRFDEAERCPHRPRGRRCRRFAAPP
jgi:hypothetical protein